MSAVFSRDVYNAVRSQLSILNPWCFRANFQRALQNIAISVRRTLDTMQRR